MVTESPVQHLHSRASGHLKMFLSVIREFVEGVKV